MIIIIIIINQSVFSSTRTHTHTQNRNFKYFHHQNTHTHTHKRNKGIWGKQKKKRWRHEQRILNPIGPDILQKSQETNEFRIIAIVNLFDSAIGFPEWYYRLFFFFVKTKLKLWRKVRKNIFPNRIIHSLVEDFFFFYGITAGKQFPLFRFPISIVFKFSIRIFSINGEGIRNNHNNINKGRLIWIEIERRGEGELRHSHDFHPPNTGNNRKF